MNVDEEEQEENEEEIEFMHKQPLVRTGMAATLALLSGTGELKSSEGLAGRAKDSRPKDLSDRDFDVKIEHRDEFGRKLTQKEAFRQLNYHFHGFGPGKKKQEKRLKEMEQQNRALSSKGKTDTGTMKSLVRAQEATGQAFITVQGGGQALQNKSSESTASLAAKLLEKKIKKDKQKAKEASKEKA